jgi:hypothetical protein
MLLRQSLSKQTDYPSGYCADTGNNEQQRLLFLGDLWDPAKGLRVSGLAAKSH